MKRKLTQLIFLLSSLLLNSPLVSAQDDPENYSGKWEITINTPNGSLVNIFELAVDGESVTGTTTSDVWGIRDISAGKKDKDGIYFEFGMKGTPTGDILVAYKGVKQGDDLAITSKFLQGSPEGGGEGAENHYVAKRVE